ncbi:hypothetical protein EK21DRAFT_80491 [Setomelanomma holmii]|uniref:Uncharacterized protein n=1 Tax=Setomelanomma holmii TaxID=210430 RepID=A0A9P4LES3_9PLEO|nr:hypothetical protein EK21DRAFT_80491 [Setomelanomma holmii]
MSSITSPSFVDDGGSFQKRIPRGLHPAHIAKWIDSSNSDTTSAYTGSYIDDGADMLYASGGAPGFGKIDPKFYKQRKRKEGKDGVWNEDIQKAVAGDIQRSLDKMRGVRNVEIKSVGAEKKSQEAKDREKDTVMVPLPPKWGTFVIKADDGRVIVVDEDGEFDSGPRKLAPEQQSVKWIKAPTMIDTPSVPPPSLKHSASRDKERRTKERKKHKEISLPTKTLTPIPESEYEDGYVPSAGEDLFSPTGFFMTGGADGWPSRPATSTTDLNTVEACLAYTLTTGKLAVPTAVAHEIGKKDFDNVSNKTYSTYRPVTVEDAPDTSSENAPIVKQVSWAGSQKGSVSGWGGSNDGLGDCHKSSVKSSKYGSDAIEDEAWTASEAASEIHMGASVQNWVGDRVKTISETSTHKSRARSHRSRRHKTRSQSRSHAPSEHSWADGDKDSEATWDGYEKPKTLSEVSVAGTGSERSWPDSQASEQRHGSRSWAGSQRANVDGWPSDQTESEDGQATYANGYDEDNATYLNENWGGVKVRVGSRRESVAGWA